MRNHQRVSFEEQLSAVPLFATLSEAQLRVMASRATRAREPAGMTFSKEGERGDELVVAYIGRHDFELLLEDAPEVSAAILETMAERTRGGGAPPPGPAT